MRLISLCLTNFQSIRDARFDFSGTSANIFGDNATGKTTLFNAVTWLLFGKASTGAKNFTPKTKGPDGDLHYLDHGVEACFSLTDGRLLTLKKVYKEDYKKKRGSAHEEFSGHVVEYYIDGIPSKEKEYLATLVNFIGPDEHMKMLMMPDYFAEVLPWEQRRRILLEMCGDVTDSDVIDGNDELVDLLEYLAMPGVAGKYYTVDEYKKIATSKCTEINQQLKTIPARIDEARKAMPDVSGLVAGMIQTKISLINSLIENKKNEKQKILSGDSTTETAHKQIAAIQTRLAEDRAAYVIENSRLNEAALTEVDRLKTERSHMQNTLLPKQSDLSAKQYALESLKTSRQSLLDKYQQVLSEQWQGDETCPTCQRPLPEDEVAQAQEVFNLSKSQRLEGINQEGHRTCSKEMIVALEGEINTLMEDIQAMKTSISTYDTLIIEAVGKMQQPIPFDSTEAYTAAVEKINVLSTGENQASTSVASQVPMLNKEIEILRGQVDELMADNSKLALAEQQTIRINALSEDEKRLSQEFETLQRGVYLCEEFIKAKVSMLTGKINSKFASVRFRLFVEQINGGIKEDCEVMVQGDGKMVPYSTANNAARINAGLEIINSLAQHWGISMPVFVDNAESVTQLQDIEGQLIRLVVNESDKTLRMEAA